MSKPTSEPQHRLRGLIVAALFFSIFTNLLMLTGPLFMLQVYDRVLASRSEETLLVLFLLVAALYFFYWLLEYSRGRVMSRVGARIHSYTSGPLFRAVMERAALRRGTREGNLQDLEAVRSLFSSPVFLALFDLPWTPVFLVAIFIFHPYLGWLAVAGGCVLISAALANQLLTYRKSAGSSDMAAAAQKVSRQVEQGSEVVWAQGMVPAMVERWNRLQDQAVDQSLRANDWSGLFSSFSKAFRFFLQSAVLALGAWLVLQGELTAGAMIAASILLGRALAPVEQGIAQWQLVQRAHSGWKDIKVLLGALPDPAIRTTLPVPAAKLTVSNLFVTSGQGEQPILRQIGFALSPGEALGVIGRSGSGKTTLARCLTGLVNPAAGEVRLDGARLDQYGAESLGKYIGYLPQEFRLFDGTIAENIAQMAITPDPAKVVKAARKASVHDIVLQLPEGYDTQIGALETRLSGGQKQRLALARAIYNDPVILILDEPNSALDAEGSEALNAVVNTMKSEGKGVLIMTHRPTAISACDKLLMLDGGKVAAFGPRDEVIRTMVRNAGDVQKIVRPKTARQDTP